MHGGPKLSTRLAIAIVSLVILTAGTVGFLSYRNIAGVAIPRTLVRIDANVRARAAELANLVRNTRADVQAFRHVIGMDEIIALYRDGLVGNAGAPNWRARIANRLVAELDAKPHYLQFRIIGLANNGRELIRVERQAGSAGVRIVPDDELQSKGDTGYFKRTEAAPQGAILTSPVQLNQEHGAIQVPYVPVIRVSTPIFANDGSRFGLLIINVELTTAFRSLQDITHPDAAVYVVNDHGDYLVHPDKRREFGFEFGRPSRIQDDFPTLASTLTAGRQPPEITADRNGTPYGVAFAAVQVQDGAPMAIVETIPEAGIVGAALAAARDSILLGGAIAVLCAVGLAILLARTMTRPLSQMTAAVAGFGNDRPLRLPLDAGGEIGVLARAFEQMAVEARERTSALRHEKEIFDSIMGAMADAVLLLEAGGHIVYENPAAVAMRTPPGGHPALPWGEAFEFYRIDGMTPMALEERPGRRALTGETVDQFEMLIRLRGSDRFTHVLGSARPIRDAAGQVNGAVVVFRDVTQMRETERRLHQVQKLDAVGQLTGGVAHDFNNMLTVISGTAEILIEDLADRPNLVTIARMIEQAAERGADLTRHLLAFARKQPLQPRSVDINTVVIDTCKLLRPTLGEHIEIESMLEDDAEPAHIDPSQLSAALLNLAVNARDAMPDGGKLMLETGNVVLDESYAQSNPDVRPGPYVMIAVSDTGTGIPGHLREKVFDPFFTTKEVGKGTGLGLSMVYGFVKQSNGHIKIYSEEGHGTSIKLYLPRADGKAEAMPKVAPVTGGSEIIMVVEDDQLVRDFVVTQLQGLGYRTIAVSEGRAALALIADGVAFDLLFTDVIMPGGLNGRQLAEAAARHRPIRVVYTSGYTENAIVHHGHLDAGVLLLPKPYRKPDLARMIRAGLESEPTEMPQDNERSRSATG